MAPLYSLFYALHGGIGAPILAVTMAGFWIWMAFDCWKNQRDSYWFWVILTTGGLGAIIYFFVHFVDGSRWEISLWDRVTLGGRIREQKARAHHLATAGAYEQLGELHARALQWKEAEAAYRQSLECDPANLEVQARAGYALLELERYDEAWKLMAGVYQKKPKLHNDHLVRQLARCQAARGKFTDARNLYQYYLSEHSHADVQFEYGQALLMAGDEEEGERVLQALVDDTLHSPAFVRRRDRRWVWKAKYLLRKLRARRRQTAGVN